MSGEGNCRHYAVTVAAAAVVVALVLSGAVEVHGVPFNRNPRVVGYYPYYAPGRLAIDDIQYDALTNINYFSLNVYEDGALDVGHIRFSDQAKLVDLAHSHGVEVSICVTGFSSVFSTMVANPVARWNFAWNVTQYCLDYDLDGVDLDWELAFSAEQKDNYSELVRELHNLLKPYGLLLTIAVYPLGSDIRPWAIEYVDWLNIMVYNFGYPHSTFDHAVRSLNHWEDYGAPREKEVLGIPFYGVGNESTYSYRTIMAEYQPGPEVDEIGGISFNGIDTVKSKTAYAINSGGAGVMIWELSHDTQDSTSLLKAIDEEIDDVITASLNKVLIQPSQLSVTASSSHSWYPDPQVVVDGSGMLSETEHSSSWGSWFTAGDDPDRWIVVDLGGTYTLKEVHVWNANEAWGWNVLGFNETAFYVANMANPGNPADNGDNWTLVTTQVLNEAPGTAGYNSPETLNLLGLTGTHVALQSVQPTWYYGDQRAGLSELQFYSVGLRADLDGDKDVDVFDLSIFADNWLWAGEIIEGDVNGDGKVNIVDFSIFAEEWLLGID
ncbi:MAG: glycosyl hydrolase family 18 protein [Planctomycetota bacterium]